MPQAWRVVKNPRGLPVEDSSFCNRLVVFYKIPAGIHRSGPRLVLASPRQHESRARHRRHLQLLHATVRALSVHDAVLAVSERARIRAKESRRHPARPGTGFICGDVSAARGLVHARGQGTAEGRAFTRDQLDRLVELAAGGIEQLTEFQRRALAGQPA